MTSSPAASKPVRKANTFQSHAVGKLGKKTPLPMSTRTGTPSSTPLPKRVNPLLRTPLEPAVRNTVPPRAMTIVGVSILALSTYCGYLYTSYRRDVDQARSLQVPEDVSDRYNQTARNYDAEVEMGERVMRLGKRRQELVRMARGDVLEVSCGTGRNMQYYLLGERRGVDEKGKAAIQGCRSLTFVDLSPQMIEIAQKKFEKLFPGFKKAAFRVQDAREVVPPSPSTAVVKSSSSTPETPSWTTSKPYFDTVLQTMGLCSTPDPVGLLRHLGSITEPQHGRILLLEHGRSYYGWLNNILDNLAPAHANRHGCWWNRDIGQIVEESGLEVVEVKRYHLGTTWRVILRPKQKASDEVQGA
ncbi:hypothetical protein VTN77DRAFT_170 [Rasamsonia byssochlamydoides]|uniref:uncharacterized protein n=1 Tax=Rasamsonia byssochlamydoides TaxID=89139 RepID=UPI0037434B80